MTEDKLYSAIENAIIKWVIDGTKTAGSLTREIMSMIAQQVVSETLEQLLPQTAAAYWIKFNFDDVSTRPTSYGKHLVCRKDGKIHWEAWNGSGWAYNHNSITHWAVIKSPKQ